MSTWSGGNKSCNNGKYQSCNKVLNRGIVGNTQKYIKDATTTSIKYKRYK
jgi:hypothetical protein